MDSTTDTNSTFLGVHGPTVLAVDRPVHNPGLHGRFLAIDLDENNRVALEARRQAHPEAELPALGWGVCRHGFGLQRLPQGISKEHAEVIACLENRRVEIGAPHS